MPRLLLRAERLPIVTRAPRTRLSVSPSTTVTCTACARRALRTGASGTGSAVLTVWTCVTVLTASVLTAEVLTAPGRIRRRAVPLPRGAARAVSRLLGHRLRLGKLQRARVLLEDHLREVAGHHDAHAEVAETRLGLLAVRERERELGISRSRC